MYIVPPAGVCCSLEVAKIQALGHHAFLRELSNLLLALEDVVGHLGNTQLGELGADVLCIEVDSTLLARAWLLVAGLGLVGAVAGEVIFAATAVAFKGLVCRWRHAAHAHRIRVQGRVSATCITADWGICRAVLRRQGTKGPDVQAVAAKGMWEHSRELAAVLVTMEAGDLWCVLEHKHFDLGVVEHIVGCIPVPDVSRVHSVDTASCLHVLDNLLGGDLGVVVVLINGKHKGQGEHTIQMFDDLLIRNASCVVHLGDHKELIKADEECFD